MPLVKWRSLDSTIVLIGDGEIDFKGSNDQETLREKTLNFFATCLIQ